jgi:hypothetical protein
MKTIIDKKVTLRLKNEIKSCIDKGSQEELGRKLEEIDDFNEFMSTVLEPYNTDEIEKNMVLLVSDLNILLYTMFMKQPGCLKMLLNKCSFLERSLYTGNEVVYKG